MSDTGVTSLSKSRRLRRWQVSRDTLHMLWTVGPGIAWIVIFLVVPALLLISIAFMTSGVYGLPQLPWTFHAFKLLAGYGILGWSPGNLFILWRTVWETLLSTSLVIVIAYPIAYYITTRPAHLRPLMLLLVVAPSWTNQVVRVIGWMNIMAPDTVLSDFAAQLGFIMPTMGLYPSGFAVTVAMVYNFLPFMTLPLYAAFERLDYAQVEAARDLQAGPVRAFFHSVVPQTLPGLVAGTVLVAVRIFGMYVIPELLGGGKFMMLGNLMARQFMAASNWPYGAAAALIMILVTLAGLQVLRRISRRASGGAEVVI